MSDSKISALLALSMAVSPIALAAGPTPLNQTMSASNAISAESSPSPRLSVRRMKHLLAEAPRLKTEPMGTFVGELQEKWRFPSDHLPIGMTFENLNIASWNVLDAQYMNWVTENSQGLSRSMIIEEHYYSNDSDRKAKLTVRDRHVAKMIVDMYKNYQPFSIIALQECSQPLLEELRSMQKDKRFHDDMRPLNFEIISNKGETILLDRSRFDLIKVKEVTGIFSAEPHRTVQEILVRRLDNGELLRLINVHLPGDPSKPGPSDFAAYLKRTFDPTLPAVVMGDMNFNELEMADAMAGAFRNQSPFSIYSPYCTNISPYTFKSKAIDHFFVYSPSSSSVTLKNPDQVIDGLAPIVSLLQRSDFDPNLNPHSLVTLEH